MLKHYVDIPNAPKAVGSYSIACEANGFIFLSGQIALDPNTGMLISGGVEEQATQVLKNISAILKSTNVLKENIVKTTIFLKNMSDFSIVNKIYSDFFVETSPPARSTVEVAALPLGALVEIELIVVSKTS
jgi:2-iminobutanoate/2-iminopropanoate deaminase